MRTIFKIFFLLITLSMTAQVDTMTVVSDHTTIEKKCSGSKCKYWVDNKLVSPKEYNKHLNEPSMATCKPCYLKQKDSNGNILYEGDFYTDCCIGTYIKRYSNGKIKIKGQYKLPPKDILDKNIYDLGYCRQEGEWKYYKENGEIEKIETYKGGELVK